MTLYNWDLLKTLLIEASATIESTFDTTNLKRENKILFTCSCGTKDSKTFRRIHTNGGAYCKSCTSVNNIKKGAATRENKLTDEEKTNRIIENNLEVEAAKAEQLRKESRDRIIKFKPDPNIWYPHPTNKSYEANTQGEVRNTKQNNRLVKGSSDPNGRTTITIKKRKYQKHRFITEALYNHIITDDYEIDHIDANPGNNTHENLQILTIKEHGAKTAATNPERGKKAGKHSSVKVIRTDINGDTEIFDSLASLIKKGTTGKTINKYIKSGKPDSNGCIWTTESEESEQDLDAEIWKDHPEYTGLKISNKGRVRNTTMAKPYNTYGSKGEYYTISFKGKQYKVHGLVCRTFHGQPSNNEETVDHIDNNRYNNCVENLRWASKLEQARNRTSVTSVEIYNIDTSDTVRIFDTQRDLANTFAISEGVVSSILNLTETNGKMHRNKLQGSLKGLSIRQANMTKEEKLKRELKILEYDFTVLLKDKNKRSSTNEKLPTHIIKQGNKYRFIITFRKEHYTSHIDENLDNIIQIKGDWIKNKKTEWINKITNNINRPRNIINS